jgi:hypothetical protein
MPTLQEIKERCQKSRLERQQKQQETELQIVSPPQTQQGQGALRPRDPRQKNRVS